jgi:glutamate formiminotransferase / formiminotetrahydrofolate cyclodeaminase
LNSIEHILECVPNFSEGRDPEKIDAIASEIEKIQGVKLLHIDSGYDANRTVITFAGLPEAVTEAAFNAVKKASEIIDMRYHKGVHPRFGATDVLPLVPIRGITMEQTIILARKLGKKIGNELGIHVYCYEFAAFDEKRHNLARCREGEYEGLKAKIIDPEWKPDFGPANFNEQSGAIAVGARNILIAYNINLATQDIKIARNIASAIRESGKLIKGKNSSGMNNQKHLPGKFKGLKAIGWYLPKINRVQVSMNITDIHQSPVHEVFVEISNLAKVYGTSVTGSELVGLIPLQVISDAGKYFFVNDTGTYTTKEIVKKVIEKLGLNELSIFNAEKRILEFAINDGFLQ